MIKSTKYSISKKQYNDILSIINLVDDAKLDSNKKKIVMDFINLEKKQVVKNKLKKFLKDLDTPREYSNGRAIYHFYFDNETPANMQFTKRKLYKRIINKFLLDETVEISKWRKYENDIIRQKYEKIFNESKDKSELYKFNLEILECKELEQIHKLYNTEIIQQDVYIHTEIMPNVGKVMSLP